MEMLERFTDTSYQVLQRLGTEGRFSFSYDQNHNPSHNYHIFDPEQAQQLNLVGLEFDIRVEPSDAILIAFIRVNEDAASCLVEKGYNEWYRDNFDGYPAYHEKSDPSIDRYHVVAFRCPKDTGHDEQLVESIANSVRSFGEVLADCGGQGRRTP